MIVLTLNGGQWNNIYSLAGIPVGQSMSIQIQSSSRVILKSSASSPLPSDQSGIESGEGDWFTFNAASSGAFAYPIGGNAQIAVSTQYDSISPSKYGGRAILYGNTIDRLATQALNYRDDAIQRGLGYYAYYNQSIASSAKAYIRFQCPPDKYVVLLGREIIMNKEALIYRTYSAYTGGTIGAVIPVKNLRSDTVYPSTSTVNVIAAPTPTLANEVTYLPLYGQSGIGNRVSGSTDSSDTFRLLAPNSVFLIELENTSTTANTVFTQFTWFELSSQVIL
jgi:hypothetical protein